MAHRYAIRAPTIAVAALSLSLLGSKCKGPKSPKEDAADAVEQAFWSEDVGATRDGELVTVELEVLVGEPPREAWATITFEDVGEAHHATVIIEDQEHRFVVSSDGFVDRLLSPAEP